jgi:hypothetical protein
MGKGRDKRKRKAKGRKTEKRVENLTRVAEPPRDDSSSSSDPDAPVYAPLKPQPRPRSGAIALPEPVDAEESFTKIEAVRISK